MGARVLIVEDHELLAQSLSLALRADGFDALRCDVVNHHAILAAAQDSAPDVVLLDLDLGEAGTSLPLVEPLTALPALVVLVTGITDRIRIAECIEAGAAGVVSKSEPFERLVSAVRTAFERGTLLAPGERQALLDDLRRDRASRRERLAVFDRLTRREEQVLFALMDGRSAEAIADEWVVSISTVRSQIRSLLLKLGVNSQLSAVALARRTGWGPRGLG